VSLRRRMGPTPRTRPAPPVAPVHAGRLPRWERLAFATVFALMIAFVAVVTISSVRAHRQQPGTPSGRSAGGAASAGGSQPVPAVGGGGHARGGRGREGRVPAGDRASRLTWDRRLATALAPVLRDRTGNLAVGVIDRSTGAEALYGRGLRFQTASIIKADILATLLLQRRHSGAGLSNTSEDLATRMIEASDDDAGTALWNLAGAARGVAAADARLGLRHTTPGPGSYWGLTTTTVGDQLALLRDLTAASSPLSSGARAYELSLMQNVEAAQRWGVSAAASPGSVYAVKNGWLPGGPSRRWVINSIGVLDHRHQKLLMVVLSSDQPTEAAGIAQDQAAAVAAATCMTSAG
jgi:hypothetical protein